MKRTKIDFLVTNVINIGLFVGIFAFGYWRWHLLQDVIIESADSQEQYRTIHSAMKSTSQLDHLGESVYEWTPSDSTAYQRKLAEAFIRIDSLSDLYAKAKIDWVKNALMLKGHLLYEIYSTNQKSNALTGGQGCHRQRYRDVCEALHGAYIPEQQGRSVFKKQEQDGDRPIH